MKKILTLVLTLALSAALLIGCTAPVQTIAPIQLADSPETIPAKMEMEILPELQPELLTGGVLCLKINPEIALHYDAAGKVTKLEGRNPDGIQLLEGFTGYEGKDTQQVLEQLVELIGKAGYFVEEVDGTARRIVLELDPGSQVPHDQFLQDMAEHVKFCVESQSWVGEKEYDYTEPAVPPASAPSVTEQTPAATTAPKSSSTTSTSSSVPTGLCPVCADIDCNDDKYCDDANEKAENLREYERLMSGEVCPTCGDYDCDDGKYCDDADEKAENIREAEEEKAKLSSSSTKSSGTKSSGSKSSSVPSSLCPVCGDDDCDDGKYCDDADEKAENLREQENKKKGKACSVCGEYDCDDGKYCDDRDERYDDDDD